MSLDSQESELQTLALHHNLHVVGVLRESMSAKQPGRPVFAALMQQIASGQADAILCWKVDRLARNFIDAGAVIHSLQSNIIKEIRTPSEHHLPTDNVLLLSVQMGMANQYSRDLSENVKRGNRTKLERGEWPNHAPFGYVNDKQSKIVVPDPDRSRYVRRVFELYATNRYSHAQIADELYANGLRTRTGKKVYKGTVKRILDNPFYCGIMKRDGKVYTGIHEPLITKSLYDTCKAVAAGTARPRGQTLFFPLRGLLTCDICGCALTASLKKGHQYYYCTNGKGSCQQHKRYLREFKLHNQMGVVLERIELDRELVEIAGEARKQLCAHDTTFLDNAAKRIEKQLNALPGRELRASDAFTDGVMPQHIYEQKMQSLQRERVELQQELKRMRAMNPLDTLEPETEQFLRCSAAKDEYLAGSDSKKHDIATSVLWNLTLRDQNIAQCSYKPFFELIANRPKPATISEMLPD